MFNKNTPKIALIQRPRAINPEKSSKLYNPPLYCLTIKKETGEEISVVSGNIYTRDRDGWEIITRQASVGAYSKAPVQARLEHCLMRSDPISELQCSSLTILIYLNGKELAPKVKNDLIAFANSSNAGYYLRANFSLADERKWILIEEGVTKGAIVVDRDILIELAQANPYWDEKSRLRSQPKGLKTLSAFLATIVVWIYGLILFLQNPSLSTKEYFFSLLPDPTTMLTSFDLSTIVIWLVLFINHLRITCGVEFAARDSSFYRAKLNYDWDEYRFCTTVETLVFSALVVTATFLSITVFIAGFTLLSSLVLAIQALFIIFYDYVYRTAFVKYDTDSKYNRLILLADFSFAVISLIFLVQALSVSILHLSPLKHVIPLAITWILCVIYMVIAGSDLFFSYGETIEFTWNEILGSIRIVFSKNNFINFIFYRHPRSFLANLKDMLLFFLTGSLPKRKVR